jgi:hypothetical protein
MQSIIISLVGTAAVLLVYLRTRPPGSSFPPHTDDVHGRVHFLHTTRSITATMWPLVLSSFVQGDETTCVLPSVVWMFLVWWLDVRHLSSNAVTDHTTSDITKFLQRGVRIEPSMLTALTFGLCGLAGARADSPYTRYIVYSLIACILVVLPHVELQTNDVMTPVISEVQRAVLIHGIATVVTCVCLTRTSTTRVHS